MSRISSEDYYGRLSQESGQKAEKESPLEKSREADDEGEFGGMEEVTLENKPAQVDREAHKKANLVRALTASIAQGPPELQTNHHPCGCPAGVPLPTFRPPSHTRKRRASQEQSSRPRRLQRLS